MDHARPLFINALEAMHLLTAAYESTIHIFKHSQVTIIIDYTVAIKIQEIRIHGNLEIRDYSLNRELLYNLVFS